MKWRKRPMTGLHTLIRSELIELIETLEAERDEFAKEIRHLSLRQSDLLTERDRYREALEAIIDEWSAEEKESIDKILTAAKKLLD